MLVLILYVLENCISDGCRSLVDCGIQNIFVSGMGDSESAAEGSTLGTWKFQEYKNKRDEIPKISLLEDKSRFVYLMVKKYLSIVFSCN